jgi:hypothetical protein
LPAALLGPVADAASRDPDVIPLGEGRWVVSGRTDLRALEESCGVRLPPSRDYVTVAGFLMTSLGRVLVPGDRVTLPEARLTVLEMQGHASNGSRSRAGARAGRGDGMSASGDNSLLLWLGLAGCLLPRLSSPAPKRA